MSQVFERPGCITRGTRFVGTSARFGVVAVAIFLHAIVWGPTPLAQNFGQWGSPVSLDPGRTLGINTAFNDGCPIEAPDGLTLYLATDRIANQLDIWTAARAIGSPWQVAPLEFPVNTAAGEFCPTPLPGHQLLFVSTRANNCNGTGANADIYYTRRDPKGNWLEPQPLDCSINSGGAEFSPSLVQEKGQTALFFSSDRGTPGQHRIYVSYQESDGTWQAAEEVHELNAGIGSDARPNVRKDGLEIVWDSTRDLGPSQIYTATRSTIFEPWSNVTPLETCPTHCVNDPVAVQSRPSLSRDGTRLYFGSSRNNVAGDTGTDIFVATRPGPGKGKDEP